MTARAGFAQQEVEENPKNNSNPDGVVNAEELAIVEKVAESLRAVTDGIGVIVVVDDLCDTTSDGHGAQGCDEGRQLAFCNELTIENTHQDAADEGDSNSNPRIDPLGHQGGGDHTTHTHHRADGKVNVSGNQYIGLANTDQKNRCDLCLLYTS